MRRRGVDGLVCDLDGVVYRGDVPIGGAAEAIARLRAAGVKIVFCTNNSRATTSEYGYKLAGLGIETIDREILTSAVVTGEVLAGRGCAGKRVIVIGGDGLRQSLTEAGLVIVEDADDTSADVVAVGLDTSFDYEAMRVAALALRAGAEFIATNDDATWPAPHGEQWPGAGALLAALERASGRSPEVMGKPHLPMLDAAERRLLGAKNIALVGDRAETDLAGGVAKGWTTILVLSGVTHPGDERSIEPAPDVVIDSLADLTL
ncbi:MAG: HAD-IIA family hydrolase [Actinomycetota bacterium]